MAVLAIAAAGSAIGSAVTAGTVLATYGASIGWALGSLVGQALFPTKYPDQNVQGPRFSDLAIQSSAYGQMLPIIYGTYRTGGKVIWSSAVREVSTTTSQTVGGGGKGGGGGSQTVNQTTYAYFVDVAIAICEGEAVNIRRGWINKELKYDVGTSATADTVAASSLGANALRFYPGSETQTIDPTIEAAEGSTAPAYRGVCYVVLENLDVTAYGGKLPALIEFEVVTSGTVAGTLSISSGITVGTTATLSSSLTPVIGKNGNVWYLGSVSNTAVLVNYFTGATVATYTRATWGYRPVGISYDGTAAVANNSGGYLSYLYEDGSVWEWTNTYANLGSGASLFGIAYIDGRNGFAQGHSGSSTDLLRFHEEDDQTITEQILTAARSTHLFTNACAIAGRCYVYGSSTYNNEVGYIAISSNAKILLFSGNTYAAYGLLVSRDGYLWMARSGASTAIEKRDQDGTLVDSVTLPGSVAASKLLEAPDGMIMAYSSTNACYFIHPTTLEVQYTSENPGTKNPIGFLSDGRLILASTSGSSFLLHEMERLPRVAATSVALSSVVSDLCDRVVLSDIDVSELTDTVRGYAIARRDSIRSGLEPLRAAYRFDAVESDGVIAFRKRGRSVSSVISEDDLAAHFYGNEMPAKVQAERTLETESPREVAVQHIDPALDYEIGSQYARRLTGSSEQVVNLDVPMVLSAEEAAGLAEFALYDAWISRNTQKIQVSRKHSAIEPTDVIQFEAEGITRTSRVVDATYEGGLVTLELVDDDAEIVDTAAGGVAGPTPDGTISAIGPSVLRLLDIPLLRDIDDGAGFYAAATGLYSGWQGAELWMSRDSGVTWERTTTSFLSASVIGTAVTVLPNFTGGNVFDEISTVEVLLINGELSSVTEAQVRSGSNACYLGGEIMSFKSAELVADGHYRLSGLRRGRKGTEQYMSTHAVGDAFVLLDTTVKRVALTTSDIGVPLQFKAVTFGQFTDYASAVAITPAAVGLECYSPVQITAGRSAASAPYDITIRWKRRNRLDGEWRSYSDVPQSETSESYEVDIYTNSSFSTVKRSITGLSSATTTYTSAQQVSDFGANQTTLYLKVYQLSSVTGRGFAGTATVTL